MGQGSCTHSALSSSASLSQGLQKNVLSGYGECFTILLLTHRLYVWVHPMDLMPLCLMLQPLVVHIACTCYNNSRHSAFILREPHLFSSEVSYESYELLSSGFSPVFEELNADPYILIDGVRWELDIIFGSDYKVVS